MDTAQDGFGFTGDELHRYSRQILLEEVGMEGQQKLSRARILVVGAGGLGSPAAIYLVAAGIGTLGIVDGDRVAVSNLHRQILHGTSDVGQPKTHSARSHLLEMNPTVQISTHETFLTSDNALELISDYDLVVNGCDNFPTRYLLNDACVMLEKPLVDAAVLQWHGQAATFLPGNGCYRCLFPVPPPAGSVPSCAEAGIIGALVGHLGSLQATEAIKIILQTGRTLVGRMLIYDALNVEYSTFEWNRNPDCPVCGDDPCITALIDYERFCGVPLPSGEDEDLPASFLAERTRWEMTPGEVREQRANATWQLIDVREEVERRAMYIPNSRSLPLGDLEDMVREKADLPVSCDDPVILYCQLGIRSARAAYLLRQAGCEAFSMEHGILGWLNEGGSVKRGHEDGT